MRKRYLAIGFTTMLMSALVWPMAGSARAGGGADEQELRDEIQTLRNMVNELNSRLSKAERKLEKSSAVKADQKTETRFADVEDMLDELDERVGANERHTVTDKLAFSVDLRTEITSLHYQDARVLPEFASNMMQLWAFDQLVMPAADLGINTSFNSVGGDYTFNPDFVQAYQNDMMPLMPELFGDNMFAGFYLPTGFTFGGVQVLPPGANLDSATAQTLMQTFNLSFSDFPADAVPILANGATSVGGKPYFGGTFDAAAMGLYKGLFKTIAPEKQDIDNNYIATMRMRLDMRADPTPHLTFGGRLTANKVYGDSTGVKWYNGMMESATMDGNVSQKGSDSALRMERGFVTYRDDWGDVHWHFSLGRRPASDGAPWEVSAHNNVGGSPLAHAINWQFDGASLGFGLDKVTGIPGANFKICYGVGFESGAGSGNSYSMDYSSDVKDVHFLGYIARLYDNGPTKIVNMYAHAFNISDGFTGLVAMPFSITGVDNNGDDTYDTFFLDANRGGYISRMEATSNVGDMDLLTLLLQTKYKGMDMFIDFAGNYARPDGISRNPMMQFMGTDGLLNSNGDQDDHTGYSIWAGITTPPLPRTNGTLGLEFNWGSKYWLGFNGAEDTLGGSKLGARGKVYEIYYHQPLIGNKFLVSTGLQYWDYDYTGSGNPMGEPVDIDDTSALDTILPVADTLWSWYINLNYRW